MTEEIKIIDVSIHDNEELKRVLMGGFRIMHAIPFESFWTQTETRYKPEGGTYQESIKRDVCMKIKYILERDNITRLLHG